MFCTIDSDEIGANSFKNSGRRLWQCVSMPFVQPYYLFNVFPRSGNSRFAGGAMFVTDVQELAGMIGDRDLLVDDVQLGTPGTINGTGYWRLDRLARVYAGLEYEESDGEHYAFVYVTVTGESFVHGDQAKCTEDLGPLQLLVDTAQCELNLQS